jgi:tetratricopeptide (TPR) repeat protein
MGETTPFKRPGIFRSAHLLYLAQISFQAQQYEKVRDLCAEILKSASHDPEALFLMGLSHYYMQDQISAIPYFQTLLEDVPDYPEVHYFLGKSFKMTGDHLKALEHLKLAMLYDPKNKKIPYCLYLLYEELNQFDDAKSHLIRSIIMAPLDKKLWQDLGLFLKKNNKILEAQDILNRTELLGSGPFKKAESNAFYALGDYLFLSENFDTANMIFQKIIMEEMSDEASLSYLAHIAFKKKNVQRGYDLLIGRDSIRRKDKEDARALLWCGEQLAHKKLYIQKGESPLVEILASHCFADLITEAEEVIIEASEDLKDIFSSSFPKARILCVNTNLERPLVDYEITAIELLKLLRPESEACKAFLKTLHASKQDVLHVQKKLGSSGFGFKIGVDSGLQQGEFSVKNCMNRLAHIPGLGDWLKLKPQQNQLVIDLSGDLTHFQQLPEKPNNLSDFAALLANLDLVITANLQIAHLAGALNIPCWAISHGLEWFFYGEEHHPFFPSIRLFSKPYYVDWENVIDDMNDNLKKL